MPSRRLLSSFHASISEITIVAHPEASTSAAQRHRCCHLKSFIDAAAAADNTKLLTAMVLDTRAAFLSYRHTSDDVADVTCSVKDLRTMLAFCEALGANVMIR